MTLCRLANCSPAPLTIQSKTIQTKCTPVFRCHSTATVSARRISYPIPNYPDHRSSICAMPTVKLCMWTLRISVSFCRTTKYLAKWAATVCRRPVASTQWHRRYRTPVKVVPCRSWAAAVPAAVANCTPPRHWSYQKSNRSQAPYWWPTRHPMPARPLPIQRPPPLRHRRVRPTMQMPCHRQPYTPARYAAKCLHSNTSTLCTGAITTNANRSFAKCVARHLPHLSNWRITAKCMMAWKCLPATCATMCLPTMQVWSATWNAIRRTNHSVVPCARKHSHAKSIWRAIFDRTLAKHHSAANIVRKHSHARSICRIMCESEYNQTKWYSYIYDSILLSCTELNSHAFDNHYYNNCFVCYRYAICRHTGESPHRCDICKKSFTRKEHYVNHYMWHTGETPHQCTTCGKKYTRKVRQLANRISWLLV